MNPTEKQFLSTEPVRGIALSIIRGLASHRKFSCLTHSHADDLWKSRGNALSRRMQRRLLRLLQKTQILGRKKNRSCGGDGWVYWIRDVASALALYPELATVAPLISVHSRGFA